MKIFDIAIKDLYQILKDFRSLLFLVAMPIVFTLFMGFAYNSGENGTENADTRLRLAVVMHSGSQMGEMLLERLENSKTINPILMAQSEALDSLRSGEQSGVLVLPADFDDQILALRTPQLQLITEPSSSDGQSLYQMLRAPISQFMSAVEIAAIGADALDNPDEFSNTLELAWAKWGEHSSQDQVQMEQAAAQEEQSWYGDNPYNQASPGILVQFAIMGLVTSAQILLNERKTRTLQRLMTTALRPWEMVAGHMLAMFGLVFLQTVLLIVFGQFALKVNYLNEPLGTLLVSIGLGVWVASMGLLIGLVAKTDDQVVLFSLIAMFLFSSLGGAWFPLEGAGELFSSIGKLMPSAWAITGYQNILIRKLDFSSTWLPAGALLAYALLFFLLSLWRFKKAEM